MPYIIGIMREEEREELERRGWEFETLEGMIDELKAHTRHTHLKDYQPLFGVWVDSNMLDIMTGLNWESGPLEE